VTHEPRKVLGLFALLGLLVYSHPLMSNESENPTNVFGEPLQACSRDPLTGFYRDGYCRTGPEDRGNHTVCAQVTEEFLEFTKSRGNDLRTPRPEWSFSGLKPGDKWCLCASRWEEARQAGVAPPLDLSATDVTVLETIALEILKEHEASLL
jgi:hypothetical protein